MTRTNRSKSVTGLSLVLLLSAFYLSLQFFSSSSGKASATHTRAGYSQPSGPVAVASYIGFGGVQFVPPRPKGDPNAKNAVVSGSTSGTLEVVVTASPNAPEGLSFSFDINQVNVSGNMTLTSIDPSPMTITIGGDGPNHLAGGESKVFSFTFGHNEVESEVRFQAEASFNVPSPAPADVVFGNSVISSNYLILRP
jgi:hypothetical protein